MLCIESKAFHGPGATDTICKSRIEKDLNETPMNVIRTEAAQVREVTSASASEIEARWSNVNHIRKDSVGGERGNYETNPASRNTITGIGRAKWIP